MRLLPTHDQRVAKERKLRAAVPQWRPQRRVVTMAQRAAVREEERLLVRGDRKADRRRHRADLDRAEERGHELGPGRQEDRDTLRDPDAERAQRMAGLIHPSLQAGKRRRRALEDVGGAVPVPGGDSSVDVLDRGVQLAGHVDSTAQFRCTSGGLPGSSAKS